MPRRKKITVKLTKDARVFLLEKMTEYPGRTVAQVCREFPENVPCVRAHGAPAET